MSKEIHYTNTIDSRFVPVRDDVIHSLMAMTQRSLGEYGIVNNLGRHITNPWLSSFHLEAIDKCILFCTQNILHNLSFRPELTMKNRINQEALFVYLMYQINDPEISIDLKNNTFKLLYSDQGSVRWIQIALRPEKKENGNLSYPSSLYVWAPKVVDKMLFVK